MMVRHVARGGNDSILLADVAGAAHLVFLGERNSDRGKAAVAGSWAPERIGTNNSIWRLEADGRWHVIFDKGCPACECP